MMTPSASQQPACGNAVCLTWANGCNESCNTSTYLEGPRRPAEAASVGTRAAAAGRREGRPQAAAARACSCVACELRRRPQSTTGVRRITTARCRGPGGQLERAISRCFTRAARDFTRQLLAKRCIADAADAEPDDATYRRQLGRRFP
jgi:hypothetical protein